jgi:hypothetical protein
MKAKILISLLAIAAIAGCTIPGIPGITPPTLGGGKGLEITSFTAEPDTVYSGSSVRVIIETENQGGATANNASSFAYLTGSNMNLGSDNDMYWRGKEFVDCRKAWGSSTGDPDWNPSCDMNDDGSIDLDDLTAWVKLWSDCQHFKNNMKPADVVKGTPGDKAIFRWNLIAPNVTVGQIREDSFIGRVYTDYETAVNGNIWVYKDTEADAAKAAGRTLNKATFSSTSGPVALEVSISPDPVVIYGTDKMFSLTIKISNLATGTIYKPNRPTSCSDMALTTDDLNKVNVDITAPDFSGIAACKGEQELILGKPATIVCDLTTPDVATFKSFPINVKVKYGYYTERTASVTVQGK